MPADRVPDIRRFALLTLFLGLSACATLPKSLQDPTVRHFTVAQARRGLAPVDVTVRWGGAIANVRNGLKHTWIEVVDEPLGGDGRPISSNTSDGRFLARFDGFVDPAIYTRGREITVVGTLEPPMTRLIGQFPYSFPVVEVQRQYLWQPLPRHAPDYYASPFWNDPWYPWGTPFY
ncbi:MAG TPA: Slp family lipoprotein [Acidiferrobacteraceae bacterium]|nr:Slp family lipoprotein [Acidiferrobacteraceae bacterium]